jgi:hypothetical protein
MKRALAALLVATALPALAAPRQKVAVLDVRAVQGVQPGTATILTAIIAGDTAAAGYDVLSQADIAALIGFERQKKMLGCGDDSSCLAEIGGALGAEYVLSTQVGQIGSRFHLSLQLLDARKGTVVARVSTFSETTEDALAATAEKAVAQALAAAKERTAAAKPPPAAAVAAGAAAGAAATTSQASTPTASTTATSTPAATATPTAGEGAPDFKSKYYLEVRIGAGDNKVPMPTSPSREGFEGPPFNVRAGMTLAPEWAVELGFTVRKLRHSKGNLSFEQGGGIKRDYEVEDQASENLLDATGVWSPRGLRWFSFAASLGVASVKAKHTVFPTGALPPIPAPVTESWSGTVGHVGAEARFDYPIWKLMLGARVGVDGAKVGQEQVMPQDPFLTPPATSPSIPWLETGWVSCTYFDLSLRYVF